MKERPILFSGEMIRAILDGRKTQTRRVVKPQPDIGRDSILYLSNLPFTVSQTLWVRETWYHNRLSGPCANLTLYKADEATNLFIPPRWNPSIHMPRKYSRITLEITGVRVERLQEISPEDALAEGIWYEKTGGISREEAVEEYRKLWDRINGKKHPWASNPFVWIIEFRRVENGATRHGS